MMHVRPRPLSLAATAAVLIAVAAVQFTGPSPAHATPSFTPQCGDRYPARRDPANPLMTSPAPPRSDPLRGANLFVDGPAHGAAAGEIARLVGIDPTTPVGTPLPRVRESLSWARFARTLSRRLRTATPTVRREVRLLEKIAFEPETERISAYSEGGTPAGIYSETQKIFCHVLAADRGSVAVLSTYFLHATLGGCASPAQIDAYRPLFDRQIDAIARATGRRPAVFLIEEDAIGSSKCVVQHGGIAAWEAALRYEATTLGALPHTLVYIEGGYSDSDTARYAAKLLLASGVRRVAGFFTNDTHFQWTSREIAYGNRITQLTGAKFIVNTADNGRGPLLNAHPVTQGVEDLCNPPGRGLGIRPTTNTGFRNVDAFLWTAPPGNSAGSCNGGTPGGTWWPARALALAANANSQLGSGFPSLPY